MAPSFANLVLLIAPFKFRLIFKWSLNKFGVNVTEAEMEAVSDIDGVWEVDIELVNESVVEAVTLVLGETDLEAVAELVAEFEKLG